jgi:tRNA(Ile2) C34 agmatinyltransferase TiaS
MIRAAYMSLEAGVAASELDREVARLRAGDPDALGALLARYQNRLYRYLLRIVRERGTALSPTCPQCGKKVQRDWANCPHCGTKLPGSGGGQGT